MNHVAKDGLITLDTPLVYSSNIVTDGSNYVSFNRLVDCVNNTPPDSTEITCIRPHGGTRKRRLRKYKKTKRNKNIKNLIK